MDCCHHQKAACGKWGKVQLYERGPNRCILRQSIFSQKNRTLTNFQLLINVKPGKIRTSSNSKEHNIRRPLLKPQLRAWVPIPKQQINLQCNDCFRVKKVRSLFQIDDFKKDP